MCILEHCAYNAANVFRANIKLWIKIGVDSIGPEKI